MDNKNVFASNLKKYMKLKNKSRKEVCKDLDLSYFTFSDWVNGKKYPRMNRVEQLANYFGILKSDLIEEKNEEHREMQKNNDAITDIIIRLRTDKEFLYVVNNLNNLDNEKLQGVKQMLTAFIK